MKKLILITAAFFLAGMTVDAYSAIMVVSVKGDASYQSGGQWKPMSKGLTLTEGTKISTGVNASAVLNIDDHIVKIKPMTSIKIYKNAASGTSSDNSIGLQYGAVQAKVKKTAAVKTRFNITTPVATSSVRGTEEVVSFGPIQGMRVEVLEGTIHAFNESGVSALVSGRSTFNLGDAQSRIESLLSDVKDGATVDVTPDNVTDEEKEAAGQSGGDDVFAGGGETGDVNRATVRFSMDWPNQ